MKILLVTHYYSTHAGGIEIVADRLATRLAGSHDVVWVASDCDPVPAEIQSLVRCVAMRSLNVIERRTGLPFPIWGPRSLLRVWAETRRADVVHLHDVAYLGNWAAFISAVLLRKPILITQHVGFIPYRSLVLRLALRTMHASIGRVMLGRAGRVVFVSRVVQDYFKGFIRFRTPPQVIANGVDTEMFVPATMGGRTQARAALGLDPARPVLLFVGRFVEKKGLRILEQLVQRMPDVSWLFAGWGPVDPRRWKAPHVRVFDDRRGSGLVPLYHAADLLVLPSVGEGLPLVVQEAMSCGTPALVGLDTAEAVDGPPGVVFGCDVGGASTPDAWESAISQILAAAAERSELRSTVAAFARTKWSWTACAAAYSRVLEELASGDDRLHNNTLSPRRS